MMCLGLEAVAAGWKAQTNPLSYGGTPKFFNGDTLSHLPPHSLSLPLSPSLSLSLFLFLSPFSLSVSLPFTLPYLHSIIFYLQLLNNFYAFFTFWRVKTTPQKVLIISKHP